MIVIAVGVIAILAGAAALVGLVGLIIGAVFSGTASLIGGAFSGEGVVLGIVLGVLAYKHYRGDNAMNNE